MARGISGDAAACEKCGRMISARLGGICYRCQMASRHIVICPECGESRTVSMRQFKQMTSKTVCPNCANARNSKVARSKGPSPLFGNFSKLEEVQPKRLRSRKNRPRITVNGCVLEEYGGKMSSRCDKGYACPHYESCLDAVMGQKPEWRGWRVVKRTEMCL
jgi:hypothetical protein